MRRSVLMSAVMAIVFAGAAVPAMTQVQLTGVTTDTTQALTASDLDQVAAPEEQLTVPLPTPTPTLTGILVDGSCYTSRGKTAMGEGSHEKCAIVCAQKGHRLAVVTDKGEVYVVIGALALNNNAKLIPFVNKTVAVIGTVKTVVIQDYLADTVQTVLTKIDKRRPNGTEEGVVPTVKKGDARQGDVLTAAEIAIEATSIDLVKVP
jgi:hypothetical protein